MKPAPMGVANQILSRISELCVLYGDVTKSSSDQANYQAEFAQLQEQLANLNSESFNGVNLSQSAPGNTVAVITTENGSQSVNITLEDLAATTNAVTLPATTLATLNIATVNSALQNLATQRAQNEQKVTVSPLLPTC